MGRKGRRAEVSYWDGNGSLASDMIESSKIDGCDWNMVPCWTFKAEISKMFVWSIVHLGVPKEAS